MEKVGVVGAGVMGRGVAQSLAQSGFDTTLVDVSDNILEAAKVEIYNNVRMQVLFKRVEVATDPEEVLSRINSTKEISELKDTDIIIENVTEDWVAKEGVYKVLNEICPSDSIFLVNTSCISITKIASLVSNPKRVIGTHL